MRYPASVRNWGKVRKTHSVGSVGDHNLGVFTIADVALKNANAVPPTHFISGAPNTLTETCEGIAGRARR